MLRASGVSVLLFERSVLKKDFAAMLTELEPEIGEVDARRAAVGEVPVPAPAGGDRGGRARQCASSLGQASSPRGRDEPRELVEATAAAVQPSDAAVLFFSSGSTSKPKGILSAHRGVCIQMWRFRRMYGFGPEDDVRCWSANGFFWSGNFGMSLGATLAAGGALVLQPTFAAAEALELMAAERVNFPFAWPHQWAQLEGAPNWDQVDLSSMRFVDFKTPVARHPTVSTKWFEPGHAYGNTETFTITTCFPANTPADGPRGQQRRGAAGRDVKIVDPLTGAVVPRGERGEICVKGPTLMLGYIGTPLDETLDAEGFFRTGDGGYLDDAGTAVLGGQAHRHHQDRRRERLAAARSTRRSSTASRRQGRADRRRAARHARRDGRRLRRAARRRDPRRPRGSARSCASGWRATRCPRHVLFFRDDEIALTGSAKIKSADLRELATKRLSG